MADVVAAAIANRQAVLDAPVELTVDGTPLRFTPTDAARARARGRAASRLHNEARPAYARRVIDRLTQRYASKLGSDVRGGANLLDEADLAALRRELLARHVTHPCRVVTAPEVPRDRDPAAYVDTATAWQARRGALYEEMVTAKLADGETGGFLVWGDPALYDGTLNLLRGIADREKIEMVSVPGISSVSALAAKHRIGLNRVGQPVQVTTGRRLAEGWPDGVDDVVVMLDAQQAYAAHPEAQIYWGAYLGTADEILRSGRVAEVAEDITATRAEARERHGWIMDTYLLRRGDS
jgi:precorrin-6A synthase